MIDPEAVADEMLALLGTGRSLPPITARDPGFDLAAAYGVTERLRQLREGRGERVVGRKIGFTNSTIWHLYDVFAPIWGYVYDTTLADLATVPQPFSITHLSEPRIEPEVIFLLKAAPKPGMSAGAILRCCAWVSHGFEIVQSVYPNWKFQPADTVAAYGLHGALFVGPRHPIGDNPDRWEERLKSFEIDLICDGEVRQRGKGSNVLGSPVLALKHLVEVLAEQRNQPQLQAGEVVTTGTLTDAMPISSGQEWGTELRGIELEPAKLRFS